MYLIACDPSINSMGWAVFNLETLALEASGTTTNALWAKSKLSQSIRLASIMRNLEADISEWLNRSEILVIEQPQLFSSYKSMASTRSGSLLILHLLVGALYWWGISHDQFDTSGTHLIPVSTWKGQLPKHVTAVRMKRKYAIKSFETDDQSDAVGLGDWFIVNRYGKEVKHET